MTTRAPLRTVALRLVDKTNKFDPEILGRLLDGAENECNLSKTNRTSRQLRHIAALLLVPM